MSENKGVHPEPGERVNQELESLKDQPLIAHYQPSFLGRGFEQVVFELPGREDIVIKVPWHTLLWSLNEEVDLDGELVEDRQKNKELRKHFGKRSLRERVVKRKIPFTKNLLLQLLSEEDEDPVIPNEGEVETIVRIQQRIPEEIEASSDTNLSLYFSLERNQRLSTSDYKELSRVLIDGGEVEDIDEIEGLFNLSQRDFIRKIRTDENLKAAVRDLVEKAIAYSNETGRALDLGGRGNILFYDQSGEWDYLLVDVKRPGGKTIEVAQGIFDDLKNNKIELEENQIQILIQVTGYTGVLNALAALSGSEERLVPFDGEYSKLSDELLEKIRSSALSEENEKMKKRFERLWEYVKNKPDDISQTDHLYGFKDFEDRSRDPRVKIIVDELGDFLNAEQEMDGEKFQKKCFELLKKVV